MLFLEIFCVAEQNGNAEFVVQKAAFNIARFCDPCARLKADDVANGDPERLRVLFLSDVFIEDDLHAVESASLFAVLPIDMDGGVLKLEAALENAAELCDDADIFGLHIVRFEPAERTHAQSAVFADLTDHAPERVNVRLEQYAVGLVLAAQTDENAALDCPLRRVAERSKFTKNKVCGVFGVACGAVHREQRKQRVNDMIRVAFKIFFSHDLSVLSSFRSVKIIHRVGKNNKILEGNDLKTAVKCEKTINKERQKRKTEDMKNLSENEIFQKTDACLLHDARPSVRLRELAAQDWPREGPFENLLKLQKTEQSPVHHPEGSAWEHTLLVVDAAAKVKQYSTDIRAFMWAALLHDIGKPATTKLRNGRITAYDHDRAGAGLARTFLLTLTNDADLAEKTAMLVRYHMQLLYVNKGLPFRDIPGMKAHTDLNDIALLSYCDRLGRLDAAPEAVRGEVLTFLERCGGSAAPFWQEIK